MVSRATHHRTPQGWMVREEWGGAVETHGPYRWRWTARLLAWLNDGVH